MANVSYPSIQTIATDHTTPLSTTIIYGPTLTRQSNEPDLTKFKTGRRSARIAKQIEKLKDPEKAIRGLRPIHQGIPTAIFQALLTASRKPIPMPKYKSLPLGAAYARERPPAWFVTLINGKYVSRIIKTQNYSVVQNDGLVAQRYKGTAKRHLFKTTIRGLIVLEEVAERNEDFARFFHAYLPPKILAAVKADLVGDRLLEAR